MNYVAIVGSQVMAVLNPILSLLSHDRGPRPDRVTLLATGFSKEYAKLVKGYLVDNNLFPSRSVTILPVTDGAKSAKTARTAHEIVKDLQATDEVCFDIAGGMSFQIASCIQALDAERCTFVYPEESCVHLYRVGPRTVDKERLPLPPSLDILRLMDVQGLNWRIVKDREADPFLRRALNRAGIALPEEALTNVSLAYFDSEGKRNDGPVFDVVINRGNRLRFLYAIAAGANELERTRQIIALAAGRSQLGNLYDREIAVITNADKVVERIEREEGNKLRVIRVTKGKDDFIQPLTRFVAGSATPTVLHSGSHSADTGRSSGSNTVLYTAIGTNPMPTLVAISSHKPREVRLLHTPGDQQIFELTRVLQQHRSMLDTARVTFVPVSFSGEDILDMPVPHPPLRAQVNITPGTKAQATFLALWAKRNRIESFSINRNPPEIRGINNEQVLELAAPGPSDYLALSGVEIKSRGAAPDDSAREILKFMKNMLAESKTMSHFSMREVVLSSGKKLVPDVKSRMARIVSADGKVLADFEYLQEKNPGSRLRQGYWFESVVGAAIMGSGAWATEINIKTAWSKWYEQRLGKFDDPHMSEVDVTALYKGDYHVISCKVSAWDKAKFDKYVATAEAQAYLFGRMAIPYLAVLEYKGKPKLCGNVWMFGYKTLLNPQQMRELLDKGCATRRTTGRSAPVAG